MTTPDTPLTTTQLIHDFDLFTAAFEKGGTRLSTMHKLYLAAVFLAAKQGRVTADDMRRIVALPPKENGEPADGRIRGGALAQLMRKGVLVTMGSVTTTVRGSNGRQVGAYALAREWRSQWLKDERLPVFDALTNLPTPYIDDAAQVPQEELFDTLARVHEKAKAWSEIPGKMYDLRDINDARAALEVTRGALREIAEATKRWAPKEEPKPENPPAPPAETGAVT